MRDSAPSSNASASSVPTDIEDLSVGEKAFTHCMQKAIPLTSRTKRTLAARLGVPLTFVDTIDYRETQVPYLYGSQAIQCVVHYVVDGDGCIAGAQARPFAAGYGKRSMVGVGLTVPNNLSQTAGYLICPEGATDTLTLAGLGLGAIGRSNNLGEPKVFADFAIRHCGDRLDQIVVFGENDQKTVVKDGETKIIHPGADGAISFSLGVAGALQRDVLVVFPPIGEKDIRTWFHSLAGITPTKAGSSQNPPPIVPEDRLVEIKKIIEEHIRTTATLVHPAERTVSKNRYGRVRSDMEPKGYLKMSEEYGDKSGDFGQSILTEAELDLMVKEKIQRQSEIAEHDRIAEEFYKAPPPPICPNTRRFALKKHAKRGPDGKGYGGLEAIAACEVDCSKLRCPVCGPMKRLHYKESIRWNLNKDAVELKERLRKANMQSQGDTILESSQPSTEGEFVPTTLYTFSIDGCENDRVTGYLRKAQHKFKGHKFHAVNYMSINPCNGRNRIYYVSTVAPPSVDDLTAYRLDDFQEVDKAADYLFAAVDQIPSQAYDCRPYRGSKWWALIADKKKDSDFELISETTVTDEEMVSMSMQYGVPAESIVRGKSGPYWKRYRYLIIPAGTIPDAEKFFAEAEMGMRMIPNLRIIHDRHDRPGGPSDPAMEYLDEDGNPDSVVMAFRFEGLPTPRA